MRLCGNSFTHRITNLRHNGLGLGFLEASLPKRWADFVSVECQGIPSLQGNDEGANVSISDAGDCRCR